MLLNWKEINLILDELNLTGSFIQQIYQPKHHILLFHLYNSPSSCTLMFSLSPSSCRLHATTKKYPNPPKPQRFVSFLRAHVRGGRITKAYQVGNERIVKLEVMKDEKILIIWIRLWGGAANMIVTDEDDQVLDACYRRPGRNEISGGTFNPEKNGLLNTKGLKKE
ncbi:MAG: NFACT family protein, partial [Spirochaetales bacterium]|nr:NFACT family protein [Spirochaetales bacterium]